MSLLLLWPLLLSCSSLQLTYSTADWILLWKLDSYFDLSASQEHYLEREVKKFHVWDRHQQLPLYVQFLKQVNQYWIDGLSQAELEASLSSIENLRVHLARQASGPGTVFLSTVTPAQLQHLQTVLDQEHGGLVSDIGNTFEERVERRVESALDTLTAWLGELSADQETHIRRWIREMPDTTDVWLAHRKNRQARLLDVLRSSPDQHTLEQGLYQWLADPKTGATGEYLIIMKKWRENVEEVVLEIDRILTPNQRAHFS